MIRSEFLTGNSRRAGRPRNQLEADSESIALLCLPSGLQKEAPCLHTSLPARLLRHLPQSIRISVCPAVSPSTPWGQRLSLIPLFVPRTGHTAVLRGWWYQVNEGTHESISSKQIQPRFAPQVTTGLDTSEINPSLMYQVHPWLLPWFCQAHHCSSQRKDVPYREDKKVALQSCAGAGHNPVLCSSSQINLWQFV